MYTVSVVKKTALEKLKDNWFLAIITSLTLVFAVLICLLSIDLLSILINEYALPAIYLLVTIFAILPLFLGIVRNFWFMANGVLKTPADGFYYFTSLANYKKAITLFTVMVLKSLPMILAFHLPAFGVWIFSRNFTFEFFNIATPLWASSIEYILKALFYLGVIASVVYMLKYYLAPLLTVSNDDLDPYEALNMSTVIYKKTNIDFIWLCLCFFGWGLISALIMPLIFTLPYFFMSYMIHGKNAVEEYNVYVEKQMRNEYPTFTVGAYYEE